MSHRTTTEWGKAQFRRYTVQNESAGNVHVGNLVNRDLAGQTSLRTCKPAWVAAHLKSIRRRSQPLSRWRPYCCPWVQEPHPRNTHGEQSTDTFSWAVLVKGWVILGVLQPPIVSKSPFRGDGALPRDIFVWSSASRQGRDSVHDITTEKTLVTRHDEMSLTLRSTLVFASSTL